MAVVDSGESNFPQSLKNIKPKVDRLFFKGNWDNEVFRKCLAVVGSRRMTNYAQTVIEKTIPPLVEAGVTIVSGFMYGVDQAAHKACLESGGKTIAVLGWGIDWQVEEVDRQLYREIEDKGLIVSEYEGDTKPQLWMFPRRNRIVAGLCKGFLVVEAAENSGSLITADYAKKYKRKLFAAPGQITSKASAGTNWLIKTGQAKLVDSAEDILKELGWGFDTLVGRPAGSHPAGGFHAQVLEILESEALTVGEIARKLQVPIDKLGVELTLMQLKGLVEERDGKYYPLV